MSTFLVSRHPLDSFSYQNMSKVTFIVKTKEWKNEEGSFGD